MQVANELRATLGGDRLYEISYEQLTGNAETYLRDICSFLGLPFNVSILNSAMPHMGNSVTGAKGKIVMNSGKWKSYFSPVEMGRIENIAGKILGERGYEVTESAGDHTPGIFWRLSWLAHDRIQSVIIAYRQYGFAFLRIALRRARDSLIQSRSSRY